MEKLLLVDGSSLLSTCFFATVPLEYMKAKTDEEMEKARKKILQQDGVYTNGVYAMMKALMKIIRNQKPTHLCVAWDLNRNTFRRTMYADYKGTRGETKPELKAQFSLAQEVLKEMGISQFVLDGFEADDIIGTLAKKLKGEIPVYILTKDQDALQLVDETIRLWYMTSKAERAGEMYKELGMDIKQFNLPDGVFEFNPMYVEHFYGVKPIQIIDRKAIEGDTSDNIPGVKGVGEASVVPLLQEFGTMEDIYDFIESSDEDTIKDMFKSLGIKRSPLSLLTKTSDTELVGKEAAELSKKLATINLEIGALQGITVEQLALGIDEVGQRRVFERFAFKSLLEEAQKVTA